MRGPGFFENVVGMFKDKQTPVRDKLLIAGGVVYIISPIDLIPDFLLLVGYVDDFACLIGTVTLFYKTYNRYVRRTRIVG
ncbi:YkvA family protein [Tumebacillus lipolyticus]|uniref:YkvA family protein n=1 Tax=Tumebacillus lipolyticus TaxID=1280370 RepID=A0ABW4ZWH0_9BACL